MAPQHSFPAVKWFIQLRGGSNGPGRMQRPDSVEPLWSACQISWLISRVVGAAGGPAGASELPGTGGKKRPQVRSRAVALSPTGQSWAAATTEGLLMYTLDQGATFDPTDLTEDITPQVMPTAPHTSSLAPSGKVGQRRSCKTSSTTAAWCPALSCKACIASIYIGCW